MKLVGFKQLPWMVVAVACLAAVSWLYKGSHGPRAFRCAPDCALVEANGTRVASYGKLKGARVVRHRDRPHLLLVTESGDLREDDTYDEVAMRERLAKVERFQRGIDRELWLAYDGTRIRWLAIVPLVLLAVVLIVKSPSRYE